MIQFPITDLLEDQECYNYLLRVLHPDGLKCPDGHPLPPDQAPHDWSREPIFNYRCRICGKVFNIFTSTVWCGTHHDCKTIVLVMRGFAQGIPTLHLAQELNLDYGTLLERRHQFNTWLWSTSLRTRFPMRKRRPTRCSRTRVKRVHHTMILMIRLAVGPTSGEGRVQWRMTALRFWEWSAERLAKFGCGSAIIHGKRLFNPKSKVVPNRPRPSTPMRRPLIFTSLTQVGDTGQCAIRRANMPVTMMVMGCVRFIAILWKGSGLACATFCVPSEGCTKSTWRNMWLCLSGRTTSSESPPIF